MLTRALLCFLALLASLPAAADMFQDAGNAKLPQARVNIGAGNPVSIKDYGAKADTRTLLDAVMATGSKTLTSVSASFTEADVGKKIQVEGAAGVRLPSLRTTIQAVTDAHTITLAAPATKTTPRRWLAGAFVATPRTVGNYIPGDLLTVEGGTYATQATLKVSSTAVTTTAIAAGGTGGNNGACRIQGTTGRGTKFQQDVTIAGGAITTLGAFYGENHYLANPTSLIAEPVANAPGYACAPTGATLTLTMGVDQVAVPNRGDYDPVAIPADPFTTTAGSISGATGATFTSGGLPWGFFTSTGSFVYGSDDSQALKEAIDAAAASYVAGKQAYVFVPTGIYLIDSIPTPLMQSAIGVVGEGSNRSSLVLGSNYVGDLFAWSNAWAPASYQLHGTTIQASNNGQGARATGISISGNRSASATQNALMFYDRNDQVFIDDVDISFINGQCLHAGMLKNAAEANIRESHLSRIRCFYAGNTGLPAMEFDSHAGEGSNEMSMNDIDIYANYGDGFVIHNSSPGTTGSGGWRIGKLRIEGLQWADIDADLLRIGGAGETAGVAGIDISQLSLLTIYPNKAAFRVTGPADKYQIRVNSGGIGSGLPMGYGVVLESGRNMSFRLSDIHTWDTNFTMGAGAGLTALDGDGAEQNWTYSLANAQALVTPVRKVGFPQNAPASVPILPDATTVGGNTRGPGAVDWQTTRNSATQVANGPGAVIAGGEYNVSSAFQSVVGGGARNTAAGTGTTTIGGGSNNTATGSGTTIPGGGFATDRGAYSGMFLGSGGCAPFLIPGSCQRSWHLLSALPNTAAATRLTSNHAAPAVDGTNCLPIPNGTNYQTVVRATARNWTSNNVASWDAIQGMLYRGTGATAYLGGAGGAATNSTAALGTLAVAADATNNCLALTYTPPAGNTASIHIVATVDVTEVQ